MVNGDWCAVACIPAFAYYLFTLEFPTKTSNRDTPPAGNHALSNLSPSKVQVPLSINLI